MVAGAHKLGQLRRPQAAIERFGVEQNECKGLSVGFRRCQSGAGCWQAGGGAHLHLFRLITHETHQQEEREPGRHRNTELPMYVRYRMDIRTRHLHSGEAQWCPFAVPDASPYLVLCVDTMGQRTGYENGHGQERARSHADDDQCEADTWTNIFILSVLYVLWGHKWLFLAMESGSEGVKDRYQHCGQQPEQ